MDSQGNKRTTEEGSYDLKFQNFSLLKNRSWPRLSSAKGQYQTINEPLPDFKGNFAAVLDGAECHGDDDYEDPTLQLVQAWPSKILPARPIKESEYSDTRYFKGVMDAPLLPHAVAPVPTGEQTWNRQARREEVDKPSLKGIRSQQLKGDKSAKRNKIPLPPPRPPVTPPKKHQPLPARPESSAHFPRRRASPEAQRGPRQISLKDISEVTGAGKVSHHQLKPEPSRPSQSQNTQKSPLATTSSSFMPSNHSMQDRDHKGSTQPCSPQRPRSPASYSPRENVPPYKNTSWRKPVPARSDEKDVQQREWYIGEYSRQAVEEALMKENKDGTFLVRDCSTKSKAEPYVLVVFHGNKVYNVKVRFLEKNQKFALGTGLRGDEKFDSVEDIIEHYKHFPVVLIDGKDKTAVHREQCYLTQPLSLARYFSPR